MKIFIFLTIALILIASASALNIVSVYSNPETIAPGEKTTISLELENNLDANAKDVSVALDLSVMPISPVKSSEDYVSEISQDDSENFDFELQANPDAEIGTYKIPVKVIYTKSSQNYVKTSFISVKISAKPEIALTSESILIRNQKNKLQVRITNTGLAKAKFLQIKLNSGGYDLLSQDSVYIGELEQDDYNTASFDVFLRETGSKTFSFQLSYKDSDNNQYNEQFQVSPKIYSQDEAKSLGLISNNNLLKYVIAFVILVVLFIIYRRIRRKRKEQE